MSHAALLDVLEASYDLSLPADDWRTAVVERTLAAFPGAAGALGFSYRLADGVPALTSGVIGEPAYLEVPDEGHESVDARAIYRAYSTSSHAEPTTVFHADPITGAPPANLARMWDKHDLVDMFGIYATRPGKDSLTIGLALPKATFPAIEPREWRAASQRFSQIARHIEAAMNVRDALAAPGAVAAEFDLAGRGEFSAGAADARAEIVEAARRMAVARDRVFLDGDGGLDVWDGLLRGRWSVVRARGKGGRLRFLAVENPRSDTLRALTALERAVIEKVAQGESNKVIAIDLDLHLSSVAKLVHRAVTKLGLSHRVHVAALARALTPGLDAG